MVCIKDLSLKTRIMKKIRKIKKDHLQINESGR